MQTEVDEKITAAEYEKLPEGPPQQLINGEIIMSPAPSFYHQRIVVKLTTIFENYVSANNLGVVNASPIDVYLKEDEVYQPDIIFISNERKKIIDMNVKGAPDLIVEVLSPSNAYYDLVHKKNIYEETGVKEYWVVDPGEKTVEVYENKNKIFIPFSKARISGTVNSKILEGFSIEVEKLFIKP